MERLAHRIRRFRDERSGAALVEFALSLPLMVLVSYLSIDGLRLMWSYQAATSGVHEAARYIARVAPGDICTTGGTLTGYQTALTAIVGQSSDGASIFSRDARLVSLTTRLDCVTGTGLRQPVVPVATVSVDIEMLLPLHRVFSAVASSGTFTARIEEQARIYGL